MNYEYNLGRYDKSYSYDFNKSKRLTSYIYLTVYRKLKNMFLDGHTASADDALLGNTRHKDALYRAKEAMEHCMETITMRMPEDFISLDLQDANRALGEITGDTSDDEIIDRIFTKFCLGK